MLFQFFYLFTTINVACKKNVIDNRRPLKDELIWRVDCWLWPGEKCPQDGVWSEWGQWGSCKGECGQVGLRERIRLCDNPAPANGGLPCKGQHHHEVECRLSGCSEAEYEEMLEGDDFRIGEFAMLKKVHEIYPSLIARCLESECHLSIVQSVLQEHAHRYWNALHCVKHNNGCPVLGGWSDWGRWSECSAKCGRGTQIKCRSCDNPLPSYSDLFCIGENCTSRPCQGAYCREGYKEGTWSSWTNWSPCSASCGPGLSQRTRECLDISVSLLPIENNLSTDLGIWSTSEISQYFETSSRGDINNAFRLSMQGDSSTLAPEFSVEPCSHVPFILGISTPSKSFKAFFSQNSDRPIKTEIRDYFTVSSNPFSSELNFSISMETTNMYELDYSTDKSVLSKILPGTSDTETNQTPNQHSTKSHGKFPFWHFSNGFKSLHRARHNRSIEEQLFCKGDHIELKPCFIKQCSIDGEWSEWEPWSQCSVACGMGVQSRSRACSAPPPSYGGSYCKGPVTHFRHCFLAPCSVNSHEVASFTGDGALKYLDMGKNIRLFHTLIRFRPIGPNGNLILRTSSEDPTNYVLLSLIGGYLVFTASIDNCKVYLINFPAIELGKWIKVLILATPLMASMRINDSTNRIKSTFSCQPKLPNFRSKMVVGQNFTGQIERLYVNYLKRHLTLASNEVINPTNLFPYSNENVEYEQTEIDEAYRNLDEMIFIPCESSHSNFSLIIMVQSITQDGILMFLNDKQKDRSLILSIEPRRVQLHYVFIGGFIECYEVIEPHVGYWMHILIDYSIDKTWGLTVDGGKRRVIRKYDEDNSIDCSNFILIGDVARTVKKNLGKNIIKMLNNESLEGLLGYVEINGNVLDISTLDGKVESKEESFSSEVISSSVIYNELKLEPGEQLELSCVYERSNENVENFDKNSLAEWIKFDVPLSRNNFENSKMNYTIIDDTAVITLQIFNYSSREVIEGFYSCWKPKAFSYSGNIFITYGVSVFDSSYEFFNGFRNLLYFVHISFIVLFALTVTWILMEIRIGPKADWGLLSSRSLKKKLKQEELAYLNNHYGKIFKP